MHIVCDFRFDMDHNTFFIFDTYQWHKFEWKFLTNYRISPSASKKGICFSHQPVLEFTKIRWWSLVGVTYALCIFAWELAKKKATESSKIRRRRAVKDSHNIVFIWFCLLKSGRKPAFLIYLSLICIPSPQLFVN